MTMRIIVTIIFLALTIVGCDDGSTTPEEDCITGQGTYYCNWRQGDGDCPTEIINSVMDLPCGIDVHADTECGFFEFEEVSDDTDCTIIATYIVMNGDDEILSARADVSVSCPDLVCYQEFHMDF